MQLDWSIAGATFPRRKCDDIDKVLHLKCLVVQYTWRHAQELPMSEHFVLAFPPEQMVLELF